MFNFYITVNNFSLLSGYFLGWTITKQRINGLDQRHITVSGELLSSDPLISSLALYQWATALLVNIVFFLYEMCISKYILRYVNLREKNNEYCKQYKSPLLRPTVYQFESKLWPWPLSWWQNVTHFRAMSNNTMKFYKDLVNPYRRYDLDMKFCELQLLTQIESKLWPWPWKLVAKCCVGHTTML